MKFTRRSALAASAAGIGVLAGCVSIEEPTAEGSWPRRSVTNARTGASATEGPTTDLHTVWGRERLDSVAAGSSPVVDDGVLYFAYSREARRDAPGGAWIEAFEAVTGDPRWTTELFRTDEFHDVYHADSTVVDGDRVFAQTEPGVTMLGADGTVRWTFDTLYSDQQLPDAVPPVVTDDVVVAGTYGSNADDQDEIVFGIDPATGDERWRATFPEWRGMYRLAASDGDVYVPFLRDGIVALDLATGEERWRWEGTVDGPLTVADDRLLVALRRDDAEAVAVRDRHDRSLRWERSIGGRQLDAGFAVADGLVYLVTVSGLTARRLDTGTVVWRFGAERGGNRSAGPDDPRIDLGATPVVAGDAVYISGSVHRDRRLRRDETADHLFVVDATTGDERGRAALADDDYVRTVTPAVTSDLVFCASSAGDLYAFGECSRELAGHCLVD